MHEDNDPSLSGGGGGSGPGSGSGAGNSLSAARSPSDPTSAGGRARHRSAAAAAASAASSAAAASSLTGNTNTGSSTGLATSAGGGIATTTSTGFVSKLLLLLTLLLKIILYPLRKLSILIFPPGPYDGITSKSCSDKAARDFVATFRKYLSSSATASTADASSSSANPFSTEGYRTTVNEIVSSASSSSSSPLLLIYLHSSLHPDCAKFCETTLSDPRLVAYLNQSSSAGGGGGGGDMIRCFGALTGSADGAHLAQTLGAAAYPFLCLVGVKSSSSGGSSRSSSNSRNNSNSSSIILEVKLKMQGRKLAILATDSLLAYLQTVVRQHDAAMAQENARRLQRQEEAMLRQEQDREYRETLEADRAREEARRAEQEREEAERRAKEEEELRAVEERENALAKAMSLVGDEPPAGTADTARVRMTLPNGRRIDRRFRADDTIEVVRAFLTVYFHENDVDISNFSLSTSFPKRTYDDPTVTLREGDLVPQAVLMVQDLDA